MCPPRKTENLAHIAVFIAAAVIGRLCVADFEPITSRDHAGAWASAMCFDIALVFFAVALVIELFSRCAQRTTDKHHTV